MLAAIAQQEFEFFFRGKAAGGGGRAELGAPGAVRGFAAGDDLAALFAEPVGRGSSGD
jgi:hypothetical protein